MSGFIDLRLNRRTSTDEGFWPSFTDIMTVVVMIFLMGLVVVLLRYMEQSRNLQSALEAERRATELARSTSQEKSAYANRLSEAEEQLAHLRMQALLAKDQRQAIEATLAQREQALRETRAELATLAQDHRELRSDYATLDAEMQRASGRLEESERKVATLEQDLLRVSGERDTLQSELGTERRELRLTADELDSVRKLLATADQELASIRGDYSDLQIKYNKLIKPARTSKGKHVVEVHYAKRDGRDVYQIRESGDGTLQTVGYDKLNQRLQALKDQHGLKLYIKLIFPEDSGLTYNEAWAFSKDVLNRYDYYHQP